jgi:hypothetical protein
MTGSVHVHSQLIQALSLDLVGPPKPSLPSWNWRVESKRLLS